MTVGKHYTRPTGGAFKAALYRCPDGHVHLEIMDERDRPIADMALDLQQAVRFSIALNEMISDLAAQTSAGNA